MYVTQTHIYSTATGRSRNTGISGKSRGGSSGLRTFLANKILLLKISVHVRWHICNPAHVHVIITVISNIKVGVVFKFFVRFTCSASSYCIITLFYFLNPPLAYYS